MLIGILHNLMMNVIQGILWCVLFVRLAELDPNARKQRYLYAALIIIGIIIYAVGYGTNNKINMVQSIIIVLIAAISAFSVCTEFSIINKLCVVMILLLTAFVVFNKTFLNNYLLNMCIIAAIISALIFLLLCKLIVRTCNRMDARFNVGELAITACVINILLYILGSLSLKTLLNPDSKLLLDGSVYSVDFFDMVMCVVFGMLACVLIFVTQIHKTYEKLLQNEIIGISYEQNQFRVEKIQHMYDEASKVRHDLKNCMLLIDGYIQNKEYEDARNYISGYMKQQIDILGMTVYCSNKVLNYIINSKFEVCQQKGIETKCIISGNVESVSDIDLSILMGNLIDNAIEASTFADKGMINVEIYDTDDILILVDNTVKQSVLQSNPHLHTLKKDKGRHGFGVISIRDIVKKYNGRMEYSESGILFRCRISLRKRK